MADDLNVSVDVSELKELAQQKIPSAVDRAVQLTAADVWGNIGREAPRRTGNLATSYNLAKLDFAKYGIDSNKEYRWWVHEGTGIYGPHGSPIVPVRAQALAFEIDGRLIIRKSVAGQKPDRFIDRAIDTSMDRVDDFINKAIEEVN